jgi:nucleoside-diphosphate-sugar epimerase
MNKKKILVIGGSGFLGTRLIDQLGPNSVINIDKRDSESYPEITIIKDIRDNDLDHSFSSDYYLVILLAAEHHDNVRPVSLYYDVNVDGTSRVLSAMSKYGINRLIFTSSVAVYGENGNNPNETCAPAPVNHYGKSKWLAEQRIFKWYQQNPDTKSVMIVRPTVIFGEKNKGNVFNLLSQIAKGNNFIIGNGNNKKSMAYVGNVAEFISNCIGQMSPGYELYNYADKPDLTMNELTGICRDELNIGHKAIKIPLIFAYLAALAIQLVFRLFGKESPISTVRVRKFCAVTQYDAKKVFNGGFLPSCSLETALRRTIRYEFMGEKNQ